MPLTQNICPHCETDSWNNDFHSATMSCLNPHCGLIGTETPIGTYYSWNQNGIRMSMIVPVGILKIWNEIEL